MDITNEPKVIFQTNYEDRDYRLVEKVVNGEKVGEIEVRGFGGGKVFFKVNCAPGKEVIVENQNGAVNLLHKMINTRTLKNDQKFMALSILSPEYFGPQTAKVMMEVERKAYTGKFKSEKGVFVESDVRANWAVKTAQYTLLEKEAELAKIKAKEEIKKVLDAAPKKEAAETEPEQ